MRLRRVVTLVQWRVAVPAWVAVYRFVVEHLSSWSLTYLRARPTPLVRRAKRIAYYLWSFPVLSETFIQREVAQLMEAGVQLDVIAQTAGDIECLGDDAKALMAKTHYLQPLEHIRVAPYASRFFRLQPVRFLGLFLALVAWPYQGRKTLSRDVRLFKRALQLAHVLDEKGVTHVHAPWAHMDALVALLAARLVQIPYTVEARASEIHRTSWAGGLPAKLVGAELVITNSQYNEQILRALMGGRADGRIRHVYEGVDLDRLTQRNGASADDAPVRILCVARLIEAKGIEYLIRACRILKDRGHAVACEIVGGRDADNINYYIALQKLRRALALGAEVTFVGAQPFERVLEKYRSATVFVLPSVIADDGTGDVTPNVLMEAMALGVPVVSTRSRGIPEIVEDGVSGLLVPPRDAQALADAILRLMQSPELRNMLVCNARRRVEQRFDVRKNVHALVALFEGVASATHDLNS